MKGLATCRVLSRVRTSFLSCSGGMCLTRIGDCGGTREAKTETPQRVIEDPRDVVSHQQCY